MKKKIFFVLLIAVMLSACAPKAPEVGNTVNVPDSTTAYQVNQDRSGLRSCIIPAQYVTIVRNTYWKTFLGSNQWDITYLSEVSVTNRGNCQLGSIFLKDEVLNRLANK